MPALTLARSQHFIEGLFVNRVGPVYQSGLETPILFVHGAWHNWRTYDLWQHYFAAIGWQTYAMSLRNHPGSYAVDDRVYRTELTASDYAQDVERVGRWIARPIVLVGHSMGGCVVQKAAESLDIRALVLLASVKPAQLGRHRPQDLPTDTPFFPDAETMRPLLFSKIDDARFEAFYETLVPESPSVLNSTGGARTPVDPGKIGAPVLAIDGALDPFVRYAEALATYYGGDALVMPDTGHNVMMEATWMKVAQALNGWLTAKQIQ